MTFIAQEYFDKNLTAEDIKKIDVGFSGEKLTGELIIQDYPNLEEIILPNHELTSLTITNCPKLKQINVRNNQLSKLEITNSPQITELIAGQNELTSLNLSNCPQISRSILCDNPLLSELKGLNLANVKDINITNTSLNLASEYEELKAKKEELLGVIKTLKENAEEKGWTLTEAIQDSSQVEEAIQRHLQKTEKEWREYLAHPEKSLPAFQIPESREKVKKTLIWIAEAQTSHDYQELADKWNEGKEYNGENDFDCGSLEKLTNYLKIRNNLKKREATKTSSLLSNTEDFQG